MYHMHLIVVPACVLQLCFVNLLFHTAHLVWTYSLAKADTLAEVGLACETSVDPRPFDLAAPLLPTHVSLAWALLSYVSFIL